MTSHHDRSHDRLSSSKDYEREAEYTRRRLAEGLDELSDRLTPGQVFDEMLTYSRAGSGTFLRTFSNAMRENPVPSLLVGAGCMMFLSEKMGLSRMVSGNGRATRTADEVYDLYAANTGASGLAASTARSAAASVQAGVQRTSEAAGRQAAAAADAMPQGASAVGDTVSQSAAAASDAVRQTAAAASDTVRQSAATAGDTVRQGATAVTDTLAGATDALRSTTSDLRGHAYGTIDQVRQGVQNMAGTVRDASSALGERLADTAGRTGRQASGVVRQTRETATSFITEQPLLAAAIGVAVGAAIASMIPGTEAEDEWMGETSDAVKGAASQTSMEALDSAKNVASKVAERGQSAVKEEGFSPSAVADAARKVGEGIQEGAAKNGGRATSSSSSGVKEDRFSSSAAEDATRNPPEEIQRGLERSSSASNDGLKEGVAQSGPITGVGPQEGTGSKLI